MTETKMYCDHCGKVLDEMKDYVSIKIDYFSNWTTDLCSECIKELDRVIVEFCSAKLSKM